MEKWVKFLQPYGVAAVCGLLMAMAWPLTEATKIVEASPIKNWTSSEYIRYSDINAVVNHLHANLGHGHGAIITANDIASNAAIRPEQTTFGSSINRNQVFVGTFKINPDGGTAYIPINSTGSLAVSVSTVSTTGFQIDGAAEAGALTDGGTQIYTVMYHPVSYVAESVICTEQGAPTVLNSPLHIAFDCYDLTDATPPSTKNPSGVSVMVFNNKVQ